MKRIASLLVTSFFVGVFGFNSAQATAVHPVPTFHTQAGWCGYNQNATISFDQSGKFTERKNAINAAHTACKSHNAGQPLLDQLALWSSYCTNPKNPSSKDACRIGYTCLKVVAPGEPCFTTDLNNKTCTADSTKVYDKTRGQCVAKPVTVTALGAGGGVTPTKGPKTRPRPGPTPVCPSNKPYYDSNSNQCVMPTVGTPVSAPTPAPVTPPSTTPTTTLTAPVAAPVAQAPVVQTPSAQTAASCTDGYSAAAGSSSVLSYLKYQVAVLSAKVRSCNPRLGCSPDSTIQTLTPMKECCQILNGSACSEN